MRTYIAIDLKSFYASVECVERKLDPLTTNLVVADKARSEKTICLAVSPSLKAHGIGGRPRLFELIQKLKLVNTKRLKEGGLRKFTGKSFDDNELKRDKRLEIDYIVAPPRMAHYIDYSINIYDIYLKYISQEDIHVYSIDEVFLDVTNYLETYKLTPYQLATKILLDVLETTGISAAAGIGTNLYLSKIAMDIQAKRTKRDEKGLQIAVLDEMAYKRDLWDYRPITSFWRVGKGYAKRLESQGLFTMGDIARCSLGGPNDYHNEDLLYRLFGVNAELLIDHAWGHEPCTIADIKAYRPRTKSMGQGQVLSNPYTYKDARLVVKEMADMLSLDLVAGSFLTSQLVLTVGYDIENLKNKELRSKYKGEIIKDSYGREIPKNAHGTINLEKKTSSTKALVKATDELFERIVNRDLLIRRMDLSAHNLLLETEIEEDLQMSFFVDKEALDKEREEKERRMQEAMLDIKKKYGKNAVLKAMNLEEAARAKDRNKQIGGHKA